MPYIKKDSRGILETNCNTTQFLEGVLQSNTTVGDINYLVTSLCNIYLVSKGVSYSAINDLIGVLECAKLELYRRVASPYENKKLKENGDVYSV